MELKSNACQSLHEESPYSEFFCLYFPTSGLNTERYGASLRIQSECGKIRTRKTPNMDAFHAVIITHKRINSPEIELMEIVVIIRFSKSSNFILLSASKLPNKFANTCLSIPLRFGLMRWERGNISFHLSPIINDLYLVSSPTHSFKKI